MSYYLHFLFEGSMQKLRTRLIAPYSYIKNNIYFIYFKVCLLNVQFRKNFHDYFRIFLYKFNFLRLLKYVFPIFFYVHYNYNFKIDLY